MLRRRNKIDPILVEQLFAQGKSQTEIARELGVSKASVSLYFKKLKLSEENLPIKSSSLIPQELQGLKHLRRIVSVVFDEIKFLNHAVKNEGDFDRRERLSKLRLDYLKEARQQLAFILEIDERRFSIEEVMKFKETVIEALREVPDEIRKKIISGLRGEQSLERSIVSD